MRVISSIAKVQQGETPRLEKLRTVLDIRYVALITTLATYGLIVLGGTVRVTGSGLACPDWPLCHGEVVPPLEKKVLIEYSHRLAASLDGVLLLATLVSGWLWRGVNRAAFYGIITAMLLLIGQVLLGGVTVTSDLSPTVVAAHLAFALGLFAALIFTTVVAFRPITLRRPLIRHQLSPFTQIAALSAVVLFALILTGSYVANTGASLAYPDWPLFDGSLLSSGGRLANLHYAHRLLAVISGVFVVAMLAQAWRSHRGQAIILRAAVAVFILYLAQVFIGAGNIWFSLAGPVRIAHLALASATWAILVFVVMWSYLDTRSGWEEAR